MTIATRSGYLLIPALVWGMKSVILPLLTWDGPEQTAHNAVRGRRRSQTVRARARADWHTRFE